MKKYIRAAAAALIAVNIFTAAAPKLYAAPESGSTDTVQQEGAVDGTQEEIRTKKNWRIPTRKRFRPMSWTDGRKARAFMAMQE